MVMVSLRLCSKWDGAVSAGGLDQTVGFLTVLFGSWPTVVHSMLSVHVIFADVMTGSYLCVSSCPPCIGTPVLPACRRIVGLNPVLVCWATRKNLSCDPELCRRSSGLRRSGKGDLKKKSCDKGQANASVRVCTPTPSPSAVIMPGAWKEKPINDKIAEFLGMDDCCTAGRDTF